MSGAPVHVVMPGDVDDPAVPSGGNTYDRRVCQGLAVDRPVHEIAVRGAWPRPRDAEREELARSLAALPDGSLVIADGLVACGVPEVVVPQARRLRLAVLVHMPLADEAEPGGDLDARERRTLTAVGAVVTTSRWSARRLVAHHGLDAGRVHVAAPGTDPAPTAPGTDGASQLLCVASVTPLKSQDVLVEALATITDLAWNCVCAGALSRAPAYVARLRRRIARLGLDERVRLIGPQTGERLASAYAGADLVVLASRAETYGMVVTEALARGIPVMATAVGGVPETVGDAGGDLPGVLLPPGDPSALAEALRRWLGEPGTRDRFRAAARRRREELDGWETTSRALSGVLERLRREPGA
ncbi:glycosyltransferase family 4 protein [Actinoallomurus bryophytorum]|uniref:Glycosyl transferase family 1 n=1 Tax=Actinoallomurus bryophytorum TaxID=1490222 RepID=A0A543CPJ1_9ACTN|nr:glycosyltransferase family 4 protein [Actinoallomurus bryophytorum]TQL99013.1 glycosyl transferase family 1 [Actinoallomurus bryophytorum]